MNPHNSPPRFLAAWLALMLAGFLPTDAGAQIHQVKEMNTEQIRALPRDKTVVLLTGGILEQHGPYLPSYTDGYRSEWTAQALANAIVERPGWHVLIFPSIPLGQGGANEIGGKFTFPGTFSVRSATLRSVFMDLATQLGDQGFRWIFVLNSHGSPFHNRVLEEAGDFFHDTYSGHMVNLPGLMPLVPNPADLNSMLTERQREDEGLGIHAGTFETSEILFLRPDLVNPGYTNAPAVTGRESSLGEVAGARGWPGYFGSPRNATAAIGARLSRLYSGRIVEFALKILDGFDYRATLRFADDMLKTIPADNPTVLHEQAVERKQSDWLKRKTGASGAESIIRRYFEEWANRGDTAVADELIATNLVLRNPPAVMTSLEDYKKGMAAFHTAFPDLRFTVEDLITEGSRAVVRWTLRGTQRGEFQGRPATGKAMTVTGTSTFRLAGGKIQEIWVNMDRLGMQEQLGWVPTPPPPK